MAENSAIEWTDHTFNPWIGCTQVSAGCKFCYAETLDLKRFSKTLGGATREKPIVHWGKGAPRYRLSPEYWKGPLRWNRNIACDHCQATSRLRLVDAVFPYCGHCGQVSTVRRQRVFCASLADWLDDEVPIEWLADLLKLIHDTPNLDWLLVSKRARAEHWRNRCFEALHRSEEIRVHNSPAMEPLLGPVEFSDVTKRSDAVLQLGKKSLEGIHWVIAGGESGSPDQKVRPMHPDWARSLRDQCQGAGVSFFFKQWGEWGWYQGGHPVARLPATFVNGSRFKAWMVRVGKKNAGRLLDEREWNEFPDTNSTKWHELGKVVGS